MLFAAYLPATDPCGRASELRSRLVEGAGAKAHHGGRQIDRVAREHASRPLRQSAQNGPLEAAGVRPDRQDGGGARVVQYAVEVLDDVTSSQVMALTA
jgi:hypothetical protein